MKILLVLILFYLPLACFAQQKFEKADFYNVMDRGDVTAIDNEMEAIKASDIKNKIGYEGALLMKKADLVKRPKRKLDLFIAGRKLLETAILTDYETPDFHFLRLAVQEHAPKIVRYHNDIDRDKSFIQKRFKEMSPVLQHAILNYCKESKVLHVEDLQVVQ